MNLGAPPQFFEQVSKGSKSFSSAKQVIMAVTSMWREIDGTLMAFCQTNVYVEIIILLGMEYHFKEETKECVPRTPLTCG